jgi:D-serine deaminase-like pyridoxal phosphate-dependent protein
MRNYIGETVQALPTPCLLVDKEQLEQNLQTMQASVEKFGKHLRPHIKTHKCIEVARMQIEAGAIGVTCATVGEAQAMAEGGINDILIANQLVTEEKLDMVAEMLTLAEVKFCVDSEYGIRLAGKVARKTGNRFEILLEVNSGANRCGVTSVDEAVELVKLIAKDPHLKFGGIQAYNGGTSYLDDLLDRDRACENTDKEIRNFVDALQNIVDISRISGAGTGNSPYMMKYGALTEIQSGSYVFSDTTYQALAPNYQPVLRVLMTVLSRPTSDRVVCDAGLKAVGTEFDQPRVLGYPQMTGARFSEEHLQWEVTEGKKPQVGEKISIIPSHSCTTVNLHQYLFVIEEDTIVDVWKITARDNWRHA